jgi:hypothetical protein
LITDWPHPGDRLRPTTNGRDTFGFLRREPGIAEQMASGDVRFVRTPDGGIYAIADGRRRAYLMYEIFEKSGVSEDSVEPIEMTELEAFPEDQPVSRWET